MTKKNLSNELNSKQLVYINWVNHSKMRDTCKCYLLFWLTRLNNGQNKFMMKITCHDGHPQKGLKGIMDETHQASLQKLK